MRRGRIVLLLLSLAVWACTPGPPEPEPEQPDHPTVVTTDPLTTLDPAACYAHLCAHVLLPNTHETLTTLDPQTLEPRPGLAETWSVSEDGTEYTFRLRNDARFHDGERLTSTSARFSLDRLRALAGPGSPGSVYHADPDDDPPRPGIAAVEAPDPTTLTVTLTRPDASLPAKLAFPAAAPVPSEGYPADEEATGVLIGSGPYEVQDPTVDPATQPLELTEARSWRGDPPASERVRLRVLRSPGHLLDLLEAGDAHVALRSGWRPDEVESARRAEGLQVVEGPGVGVRFLAFNVDEEPFTNLHARQAVAAAIDRRDIVETALEGAGRPLRSLLPDAFEAHAPVFEEPDHARPDRELTAAGFDDGEVVSFDLWHTPSRYGDTEEAVAESIEAALEDTGRFEVTLRSLGWGEYKGALARGDLGVFLLGWHPDVLDPDGYLRPFLSSRDTHALGINYTSEEADRRLDAGLTAMDRSTRVERYLRVQHWLAAEVPVIPLWQTKRYAVLAEGVTGLDLDGTAPFVRLHELELAE